MQDIAEFLHEEDVVTVEGKDDVLSDQLDMPSTFRVQELKDSIEVSSIENILDRTFECRVLCQNKTGWRSGTMKVRLEIEFQPDKPDHQDSFDELRNLNP